MNLKQVNEYVSWWEQRKLYRMPKFNIRHFFNNAFLNIQKILSSSYLSKFYRLDRQDERCWLQALHGSKCESKASCLAVIAQRACALWCCASKESALVTQFHYTRVFASSMKTRLGSSFATKLVKIIPVNSCFVVLFCSSCLALSIYGLFWLLFFHYILVSSQKTSLCF